MKKHTNRVAFYLLVLILPILVSFWSYNRFNSTYKSNIQAFESKVGAVAGTKKTSNDVFYLPDNIPIMNNSQVLNFDTGDKNTSITYETNATKKQIETFYAKFIQENGFVKTSDGVYSKGNKELNIKINENIVVINYYEK